LGVNRNSKIVFHGTVLLGDSEASQKIVDMHIAHFYFLIKQKNAVLEYSKIVFEEPAVKSHTVVRATVT
jgi:hypothetical protein